MATFLYDQCSAQIRFHKKKNLKINKKRQEKSLKIRRDGIPKSMQSRKGGYKNKGKYAEPYSYIFTLI